MLISQIPAHFKNRRESLIKNSPASVFIFPSNAETLRNPDVHYPFRQESNFYYFTGFEEPESFLVIASSKSKPGAQRTILFVRKRDPERELWDGERYGIEGARNVFKVDEAYSIDELDQKLPEFLDGSEKVYYRLGLSSDTDRVVLNAIETFRRSLGRSGKSLPPLADPNEVVGEMRLFKDSEEVADQRKACQITAQAHKTAMKEVRPGMNEFEIEALVDYHFRKNGCKREGYGSIVAGGKNAACLHYRSNNEILKDGDLLLIDAGGEYNYYSADITRTFPIGHQFTKAQARVYDLVLKSQKECIDMTKPGITLREIHQHASNVLIEGYLSLGLMKGKADEIFKSSSYRRLYPHNTSHWLGMDVHDSGLYLKNGEPRPLEAGMVFTIEPGFYVQPMDKETPAEYHGIGIRIEDDILVTKNGCEVLTRDAPKEREEIEALRRY